MTQATQSTYDGAQDRINAGMWSIDPEAGVVYGTKGQPIGVRSTRGYIYVTYRDSADPRIYHNALVHRVVWEYVHGPIPGLDINHLNGVKTDNRIANLEAVTRAENNRHARETGLHYSLRGERQPNSKLTERQVQEIYRRVWSGETTLALAAEFAISSSTVSTIKRRVTWAHITQPQAS
jgi:hypothetical protein